MANRIPPRLLVGIGLTTIAIFAAYAPVYRAEFLWDDDEHVTTPELRSLHGLSRIWFDVGATQQYYPLLHSAFWIEHRMWGDRPLGYHLVNLALHAINAALVMLIVRRLLWDRAARWADATAILTAAVFALHPVHVESVAWISEQKNTLSAAFYLSAALSYLRFDRTRRWGFYAAATAFFLLSLLTKPVTVTLPAAMLGIFWWQRGRMTRRDIVPLLPWFALSIASGLFAAWVEHSVIGAKGTAFELSAAQRLLLPGRVVAFYLSKLLWPTDLLFVYPRWTVDPTVWWQWLYPVGLIAGLTALGRLCRRTRSPLAGVLFYVGSLFPVLGFFNVYLFLYTFVADHFQYLPSLGVIAVACGALVAVVSRIPRRGLQIAMLSPLPIVLGVLTFQQCGPYSDSRTMYETVLQKNPDCWMAYNNLGQLHANRGELEEAARYFSETIRLNPKFAEARNNLGHASIQLGRLDDAEAHLQEAIRLVPHYVNAHFNLGLLRERQGRREEAIAEYRMATGFDPHFVYGYLSASEQMAKAGESAEALAELDRGLAALQGRPDAAWLYKAKAAIFTGEKKFTEAIPLLERAVSLAPRMAEMHLQLAHALAQAGRLDDAVDAYQRTLAFDPGIAQAHYNVGVIRMAQGNFPEARANLEQALRLRPDYTEARERLADLNRRPPVPATAPSSRK
ncbi:MAG TPA: tetratricopeptide repeat protein [Phycisphaerae bacterium]|nr:tetratricopeptide repeat protein [Phycisphaerae bacterium]